METIESKAYGKVQVPENSFITLKKELLGFEGFKHYYLLEMKDLDNFFWFQSKKESSLAFVVVNPRIFKEDYELDIDDSDMELLELDRKEDIADLVIVNIPDDPSQMTLNLLGPIIINTQKRLGIQGISNKNDYSTKFRVFHMDEKEKRMVNSV